MKEIKNLYHAARCAFPRSWIQGAGSGGTRGADGALVSIGGEGQADYLRRLLFGDGSPSRRGRKRCHWWDCRRLSHIVNVDQLGMLEIDSGEGQHLAKKEGIFFLPRWMTLTLDLSIGLENILRRESLKSDVRKLKKFGLSYRIGNMESDLKKFYEDMYVPHTLAAHQKSAHINEFGLVQREIPRSELLLVKHGDSNIGGALIVDEGEMRRLWMIGIAEPSQDHIKLGALSALYYYTVEHLIDQGVGRLNMGLCRPFLSDGATNYKRKWNPEISGVADKGWLMVAPKERGPALVALKANPFVNLRDGELWVTLFVDDVNALAESERAKLIGRNRIEGINRYELVDINQRSMKF